MILLINIKSASLVGLMMASCAFTLQPAHAISLKKAVSVALDSNPDIGQSIENREAHEFELRQAKGLPYLRLAVWS